MVMTGSDDEHACKVDEEFEALMKTNGWRYCPGKPQSEKNPCLMSAFNETSQGVELPSRKSQGATT